MREILFRGKRLDNGEWVEGHYHYSNWYLPPSMKIVDTTYHILPIGHGDSHKVDPQTVGQFTGLTDKNGKKVFEGDIIRSDNGKQRAVSVVKYGAYKPNMVFDMFRDFIGYKPKQPMYGLYAQTNRETLCLFDSPHIIEVIGNIHDNPELLGGTDNG